MSTQVRASVTGPFVTFFGSVAALLGVGAAVAAETTCPDSLAVRQSAEVPAGWSLTLGETPPRLASVTLYDGQPANRAVIKVSRRQQAGKELRMVWMLPHTPRSVYLQCGYERSAALISTPLPPGTSRCEVVIDRSATYPSGADVIKRMVCS